MITLKRNTQNGYTKKNKTGNLYNPQTNTFNLTNEEWEDFKKGHPKAASLKTVPLVFPELYAELFDGNSASDEDDFFSSHTSEHFTQPPPSGASPSADSPSGYPNKRVKPSTPRPRAPSA
ncbi:unnamed protein product [Lactuca saligna]|uniref:Uncharacterized protein n=1 Tax=Lactuca saligna TaxID=75948 RepID=A0AA35Z1J5_LACSI|nr:unnamed protein product [Lactuca saligna]